MRPRDRHFRLHDMAYYAECALRYTQGLTYEQFKGNQMRVAAVLHVLVRIGDGAVLMPREIRRKMPDISWTGLSLLRNLRRNYSKVDLEKVWNIVHRDVPSLLRILDGSSTAEESRAP